MNTLRYITVSIVLLLSTICLIQTHAQVDQTVTVEKEYKPVIQDAGKITSVPEVIESGINKTTPHYTDFNLPMAVGQNIYPLSAAELQHEVRKPKTDAFVRIGMGNYWNTLAQVALPVIKQSDTRLDFTLDHSATFGLKAHSKTNADLSFDRYFKTFNLYAGLGVGHEYIKYYGNNFDANNNVTNLKDLATLYGSSVYSDTTRFIRSPRTTTLNNLANDSTHNNLWRVNAFLGIRSLPNADGLRYQAELQYKTFNSQYGISEDIIHTSGGFSTIYEGNHAGIDMELTNLIYHSTNPVLLNYTDAYAVFSMNPYYSIEHDVWSLRIGLKSAFSFAHGRPFNPTPDVRAEWKVVPKWLVVYGGVGGNYQVNSMNSMFDENRYLFPNVRVKDTYTPVDVYAGVKFKPVYNMLVDAFVEYKYMDNQYFFVNKAYTCKTATDSTLYSNRFDVVYSKASLFRLGMRANYNIRNLVNVELKGVYNGWDVYDNLEKAWNKSKWEANLNTDVKITRDLNITANLYYEAGRFAKIGSASIAMKPKFDVNLGASYSYNTWLTAFARLNNLINSKYQDFYGYNVQGINFMMGAAVSF